MKIRLSVLTCMYYLWLNWEIVLGKRVNKKLETFQTDIEETIKKLKTDRPVIGMVAMPMKNKHINANVNQVEGESHIGASFVKLVESAGARVIPLLESFSDVKVNELFKLINGVLLPGGLEDIIKSDYQRISTLAFNYSIAKYKEGEIWPILGICRGFQMLLSMHKDGKGSIMPTDALNITMTLKFTEEAKHSRLMGHASPGMWDLLKKEKITFNAHINGYSSKAIRKSKEMKKMWRIISTNEDRKGKEFVSIIEGKEYPFYGLQWHPEKSLFIWNPEFSINHSIHSLMVSQYMANFFVMEARKNSNAFRTREEAAHFLMYQYPATYVGNVKEAPYEQIYRWKKY